MIETLVIVFAVHAVVGALIVLGYAILWLLFATPLLRWFFISIVLLLMAKVILLPISYLQVWWQGI